MKLSLLVSTVVAASIASAKVLWDGRFSEYATAADFDKWSWSNQVGSYQTYIYGNLHSETASSWLTLGNYTKPSGGTAKTVKVKLTTDSTWNSGPMRRTELIPQSSTTLTGYFHFSLLLPSVNKPNQDVEHQIVFWESHASEIKYGQLNGQSGTANVLRFMASGSTYWSIEPETDVWYNFAIQTGSSGGLYYSKAGAALTKVWTGNTGTGGNEFHVGHLRLTGDSMAQEDIYYAGVYVEDTLTTAV